MSKEDPFPNLTSNINVINIISTNLSIAFNNGSLHWFLLPRPCFMVHLLPPQATHNYSWNFSQHPITQKAKKKQKKL